jgi:hypothetical protein
VEIPGERPLDRALRQWDIVYRVALPYGLAPVWLIAVLMLIRPDSSIRVWVRDDPHRLLSLDVDRPCPSSRNLALPFFPGARVPRSDFANTLCFGLAAPFV